MSTTPPGGAAMTIDPQQFAETTAEWWESAHDNPQLGQRLASAKTTVHIHYTDTAGVTLRLDRVPIEAEPRIVGDAEVEMWGSAELFWAMIQRERQMAMAIADGDLEYEGPVRKFLRIVPIMRSLDHSVWHGFNQNGASGGASGYE